MAKLAVMRELPLDSHPGPSFALNLTTLTSGKASQSSIFTSQGEAQYSISRRSEQGSVRVGEKPSFRAPPDIGG